MNFIPGQELAAEDLNDAFAERQRQATRINLRNRRAWRIWGNDLVPLTPGRTTSLMMSLESEFVAARAVFVNNTATAFTVNAVAFAPSSAPGNTVDPVGGTWVLATTDGGGANGEDIVIGGTARSLLVPAGSVAKPSFAFTDWVPVQSLSRTDGGVYPLLLQRTYIAGGSPVGTIAALTWEGDAAAGRVHRFGSLGNSDQATTPGAAASLVGDARLAPWAVEYMTRRGLTLLVTGDSLEGGVATYQDRWPFALRVAQRLSTPDFPITAVIAAMGGKNSSEYGPLCRGAIDALLPEAVLIPLRSPNDTGASGVPDYNGSLLRALFLAQHAMRRGSVPILVGPMPQGAVPGGNLERIIKEQNARALSYLGSGALLFDPMPYLGVFSDFFPGLSGDRLHPNDAGHAALDYPFGELLKTLL